MCGLLTGGKIYRTLICREHYRNKLKRGKCAVPTYLRVKLIITFSPRSGYVMVISGLQLV